jgi:flagellar biosynthesis/type III secretory pathway protein FliH
MATIIRNNSSSQRPSGKLVRPVAFHFEDMNDRADEYLETVRREAAKIVQQAHVEAEQVRRQAVAAGQAAAREEAQRELNERIAGRLNSFVAALERLVAETNEAKADWLRRWEQSAVAVAAAIAERIIRREIQHQPEISLELVREALQLAAGASEVTLHLNPSDYELLGGQADALAKSLGRLAPTNVVADDAVSAGGCVVQTRLGRIDQQIESQLARIQQELA